MYGTLSRCQVVAPVAVHEKPRTSLSLAAPVRKHGFRSYSHGLQRKNTIVRAEAETLTTEVTETTFQKEVLESPLLVIVDFWAPWCGPCRMIAPLIDELAVEYSGKLKAVKLNTDEAPGIATQYGIRSIPTVMVFKDGKKVDCIIGAVPKSTLTNTIEKYMD